MKSKYIMIDERLGRFAKQVPFAISCLSELNDIERAYLEHKIANLTNLLSPRLTGKRLIGVIYYWRGELKVDEIHDTLYGLLAASADEFGGAEMVASMENLVIPAMNSLRVEDY